MCETCLKEDQQMLAVINKAKMDAKEKNKDFAIYFDPLERRWKAITVEAAYQERIPFNTVVSKY